MRSASPCEQLIRSWQAISVDGEPRNEVKFFQIATVGGQRLGRPAGQEAFDQRTLCAGNKSKRGHKLIIQSA